MAGKPWFLYLIECRDGSIYTGITVDVASRYAAHESGKGARYTRSHPPRCLLAVVEYADRSAALKAEYEMKKLSAAEKRTFASVKSLPGHLPMPDEA
jgi:putative endonuclease